MRKGRGQSTARALRRGNIDMLGNKLSRPFSNKKRTKGAKQQISAEKYYRYMLERMRKYKNEYDLMIEEKMKELEIKDIIEDGSEGV